VGEKDQRDKALRSATRPQATAVHRDNKNENLQQTHPPRAVLNGLSCPTRAAGEDGAPQTRLSTRGPRTIVAIMTETWTLFDRLADGYDKVAFW
jgi:hypothetical protein